MPPFASPSEDKSRKLRGERIKLGNTCLSCRLIDRLAASMTPHTGDLEIKGNMDPPLYRKQRALSRASKNLKLTVRTPARQQARTS
jgi:hypothetical protein